LNFVVSTTGIETTRIETLNTKRELETNGKGKQGK
jgi:hypothetical protein